MAFRKLGDNIDASDMAIWSSHPCAREFVKEIESEIARGFRDILKRPCSENAEKIKAFQKVVGLFEEAQKMG